MSKTPITDALKSPAIIALEFVTDQASGEWGDETIKSDAQKMVDEIIEPERAIARRLEEDRAALVEALREVLAAGDAACSPFEDEVAAMLRFGEADKAARALLSRIDGGSK